MKRFACVFALTIGFVLYAVYSFALVDPNLVLNQHPAYWAFQQNMWQLGFHQQQQSAVIYAALIAVIFLAAFGAVRTLSRRAKIVMLAVVVGILFFSYPALSHDIFNYLFNAKMVLVYKTDPHVHVALEFPKDEWVRFMHNTHTTAPYGYGWTALSLLPFGAFMLVGGVKFLPMLLTFRVFMIVGWIAVVKLQSVLAKVMLTKDQLKSFTKLRWWFLLSPLVLIETVGTIHNDVWMMAFALAALIVAAVVSGASGWKRGAMIALSLVLLGISASTKFATVLLVPVVVTLAFRLRHKFVQRWWADVSAILLFLPLFLPRSQQFHPWYLIWSLTFFPFLRSKNLRLLLMAFSVSSLFRYIPFILVGEYTSAVLWQQQLITWVGGVVVFVVIRYVRWAQPHK